MSITNKQKFFASLALIYGALCWGVIWFPYRLLNSSGLGGVHASLMSYLFALLMGACLFYRRWRLIGKLPLYSYWLSVVAGWTNLAYVLAVIDGEVMRVMLLFYLSPLWTLLLARVWLSEVWRLPQLIAIILSLIGASLMLTDGQWMLPIPQSTPDWLALSAGIGFSITNVMTRFCAELSLAAKSMLVWLGVFVMSILLIGWQPTGISPLWSTTLMLDAYRLSLLMLIALLIVTATLLVQYGVTQMPAIQASVLFMTELIVAAIAAYFLAHETMTVIEMVGGGCIILAGLLSVLSQEPTTTDST